MESANVINLPDSSNSGDGNDNIGLHSCTPEPNEAESIPSNPEVKEDKEIGEIVEVDMEIEEEDDIQTVLTVKAAEAISVDKFPLSVYKKDGDSIIQPVIDGSSVSGVKRPRVAADEQQSSVHVVYSSLPRIRVKH
jgi:hypothetical protein